MPLRPTAPSMPWCSCWPDTLPPSVGKLSILGLSKKLRRRECRQVNGLTWRRCGIRTALEIELGRIRREYNTVRLHAGIGYVTRRRALTEGVPPSAWNGAPDH